MTDHTDIVERLEFLQLQHELPRRVEKIIDEGCAEITRLRADSEKSRSAALEWSHEMRNLEADNARLRAEAEALRKGAERYETVRRMSVTMFQDAYVLNRRTGKPFDEIVDDLRPFMFPAIDATKGTT